ncbi:GIY-YIG nuclease family protein [Ureibacillus chungkukjangi]|uniref:GIY-YIG nuclease family protein n=1 Tax=Ureibacillus chungkukjangi TaxID=1202712 RepID=UPI00203E7746|nr:GIY-YIG nuclease family protein [Ureibacillus chungkukjangi]MCM3390230.1 GIY-YIG nuclease family protein [Ureibacillus chungkukjangi]
MIHIELPNPSERVFLTDYKSVRNKSGFYIMKNNLGEIIYIGESENIRKRLSEHYKGKSGTTKSFKQLFTYVEVFYCSPVERKIYEIYAINLFNPPGNVWGNCNMGIEELKRKREDWIRAEEEKLVEALQKPTERKAIKILDSKID